MFGVGGMELIVIVLVALLLFGPAVVVTWLVVTLARGSEPKGSEVDERSDPAMIVARERYARGEITAEELEEMSRTLGY